MHLMAVVNRWFLLRGLPGLRRVPGLRDMALVHGYFWIRSVELPAADRSRLESAVNSDTVAFLGPNHPEFGTDWMVDKEISTMVSPLMASWADRGVVAMAPTFWGMNNLVANDGGEAAKDYSVEWALKGEGVLLHPEGTVRWTNDVVHPLFPGIAQMAMKAAAQTDKPVYIVPLVWKYQYVGDVSPRIAHEIDIVELGLRLPSTRGEILPRRFAQLQRNILSMRLKLFGFDIDSTRDFFEQQRAFQQLIIHDLEARHAVESSEDIDKIIARLARTVRGKLAELENDPAMAEQRAALRRDAELADEAKRLGEFSAAVYSGPTLTQEQLFESLKRTRDRLLRRGWRNVMSNMFPRPFGPRVAHVGVPEPIRVTRVDSGSAAEYESTLLTLARERMQRRIDEINARIEPEVERYRWENPFARSPN